MTLPLLLALVVVLTLALAAAWHRRSDLRQQGQAVIERAEMSARTNEQAPLVLPVIDLNKCLGCGTCVRECPEDGVLGLVHGQAAVVNAAACVGHARCVSECPAGAVTLATADATDRRDVPVLDDEFAAVGTDGVFLVGEITARSLIRTAATQGTAVAATIAARCAAASAAATDDVHDVVIVGAGPGGLACALGCVQHSLRFLLLDQEQVVGGSVAKYPRRKLVLTDAIELPLHGRLPRREYAKEELMALWEGLAAEHQLPFQGGVTFDHVERCDDGMLHVHTDAGFFRARHVVLAVGRRGTPKRLGVPGEDLPHVTYSLLDAATYHGRHCVVIGGGDSAVETALALADQADNQITVVYRQDSFFRLRSKNKERIAARIAEGRIEVLFRAEVQAIGAGHVDVLQQEGGGPVALQLRADDVFVMIGGSPPFAQLEKSGVSFDPALRAPPPAPPAASSTGNGLLPALAIGTALAAATLGFVLWHRDYYLLVASARAAEPKHALLRPDRSLGLWFGLFAAAAIVANLAYLLRRQQWLGVRFGQLSAWMGAHVATGVIALLLAMLHGAMAPKATAGGYAFWALVVLAVTGAIGRWFYAWLPRHANGREMELDAVRTELTATRRDGSAFTQQAHAEVLALLHRRQWRSTWFGRVIALLGLQWDLWRTLRALRRHGETTGADRIQIAHAVAQARRAHAAAIATAHLEDLRALLGTWRWLHRWLALLMVLLLVVHVVVAILHGAFAGGGGL